MLSSTLYIRIFMLPNYIKGSLVPIPSFSHLCLLTENILHSDFSIHATEKSGSKRSQKILLEAGDSEIHASNSTAMPLSCYWKLISNFSDLHFPRFFSLLTKQALLSSCSLGIHQHHPTSLYWTLTGKELVHFTDENVAFYLALHAMTETTQKHTAP